MLGVLVLSLVVSTSIWVGVDAATHRVHQIGQKEFTSQDPWIWAIACILFWIVFFPLYLLTRASCLGHNQSSGRQTMPTTVTSADELLKFKQLLDAGAITSEEFDAAKVRLIGRDMVQAA
jgi:hypothetical protein